MRKSVGVPCLASHDLVSLMSRATGRFGGTRRRAFGNPACSDCYFEVGRGYDPAKWRTRGALGFAQADSASSTPRDFGSAFLPRANTRNAQVMSSLPAGGLFANWCTPGALDGADAACGSPSA